MKQSFAEGVRRSTRDAQASPQLRRRHLPTRGLAVAASVLATFSLAPTPATGQPAPLQSEPAKPTRPVPGPAPRLPENPILGVNSAKPDLGGSGVWFPAYLGNMAETAWHGFKSADAKVEVPFKPWAKAKFEENGNNLQQDPEAHCLPPGLPRMAYTPYPFEILQLHNRIVFIYEGGTHVWRTIWMDGRAHPKDPNPTYLGDSIGHWEGDTLVVDAVGFNDKTWLDQAGHPHTEQLHVIERYRRTDSLTLEYEVTIDDPGAYTKPWKSSSSIPFRPGGYLMEYICQEGERDVVHMLGDKSAK